MSDRRRDVGLFRYSLIREAADPALSKADRGALVRDLAGREHVGPDGERIRVKVIYVASPTGTARSVVACLDFMNTADKPSRDIVDPREILLGFLDYCRSTVERKVARLSEQDLRTSRLPSGWTPLELVKHLVYMERRWFRWGFLAEQVDDPFGDEDDQERWRVGEHETVEELIAALHAGGVRTREIAAAAALDDVAATGGRFAADDERPQPTLAWTLAYVLQEYARHLGQLDVARELVDGSTGE